MKMVNYLATIFSIRTKSILRQQT